MAETADVVIIGGGIVGSSIAYHLAEAGCTNVLIIEREEAQGMGSSGKGAGGVRAQFATAINIEMSLYSIDFFAQMEELTGYASGYRPYGYLFIATNEKHLDYLRANRERQMKAGLRNVEMVAAKDISGMLPQLRVDDVLGGSFCQTDGFVEPLSVLRGFTARAKEKGARVWLKTEVIGIEVENERIAGVMTTRGQVATRTVINAGGAWAAKVARLAGVEIPVEPLRRQLVITKPFKALPERVPMTIDMSNGFHFRREPAQGSETPVLMAWPAPDETPGFKTEFEEQFVEKIFERATNRVPCFREASPDLSRCRAGLYEVTPDHHAIIGEAKAVKGLFFANGFSGHGVMHSPATGRIVSELVLHGSSQLLDVAPLGAERFAEGRLIEETAVL